LAQKPQKQQVTDNNLLSAVCLNHATLLTANKDRFMHQDARAGEVI
jgi:hypothetical protein